jgi:hypothetical protein
LELVRAFFLSTIMAGAGPILPSPPPQETTMPLLQNCLGVIHVRFEGRSFDLPLAELDLGEASSDADIKRAVARSLDISEAKLCDYVVDRHETGNLTVRPEAVFG